MTIRRFSLRLPRVFHVLNAGLDSRCEIKIQGFLRTEGFHIRRAAGEFETAH